MPNIDEIMTPEMDHWQWSLLPRPVQKMVWKVYEAENPEPPQIKAIISYYYEAPNGTRVHLFEGTYLIGEDGPDLDVQLGVSVTAFGEQVVIKRVERSHHAGIDLYEVFIDIPKED